jgi:hypothetical protein
MRPVLLVCRPATRNSNDEVDARLCARTVDGRLRKVYGPLPPWAAAALEGLPRHAELEDMRT